VEILVGECSLYSNYLLQSSFLFDVGTPFPHLLFSTTPLVIFVSKHGRNLVGDRGDVSPTLFQTGVHDMPCPPTFLSLGFVGEVSKIKVMFVTFSCE